jgi:hypothetical protein
MSFWYLATVYSKYRLGIVHAHAEACRQAALLVRAGIPVYSPIAHTHPIAIEGDIDPFDHEIWLEADRTFMEAAKGLIVCKMQGWEESYGIGVEIESFERQGKPIYYMEPDELPDLTPDSRIIAFCGVARSGKDTAAQALTADGWHRVAFADGVREALLALNPLVVWRAGDKEVMAERGYKHHTDVAQISEWGSDWEYAKRILDIRALLQRMGTEAGRDIHGDDCWIRLAERKVAAAPGNVVITDCRFANEADAIRSWGGLVVRIERDGVTACNEHASERLDFEPDAVLRNDGTIDELHAKVRELANGVRVNPFWMNHVLSH